MFFRITPPKNSTGTAIPASVYLNLDEISRVEEVRRRTGEDNDLQLKVFMKDGHRQDLTEENTSRATMQAILKHLEGTAVNPKKGDPKWEETEKKVADEIAGKTKAGEKVDDPSRATTDPTKKTAAA